MNRRIFLSSLTTIPLIGSTKQSIPSFEEFYKTWKVEDYLTGKIKNCSPNYGITTQFYDSRANVGVTFSSPFDIMNNFISNDGLVYNSYNCHFSRRLNAKTSVMTAGAFYLSTFKNKKVMFIGDYNRKTYFKNTVERQFQLNGIDIFNRNESSPAKELSTHFYYFNNGKYKFYQYDEHLEYIKDKIVFMDELDSELPEFKEMISSFTKNNISYIYMGTSKAVEEYIIKTEK